MATLVTIEYDGEALTTDLAKLLGLTDVEHLGVIRGTCKTQAAGWTELELKELQELRHRMPNRALLSYRPTAGQASATIAGTR